MDTNSSCFICRDSSLDSHLPNGGMEVMQNWHKKCATALCDTLNLDKGSYGSVFATGPFCSRCQELLYNLEFIVNSISCLQAKLEVLSDEVKGLLVGNYDSIQWQRSLPASTNLRQSEGRLNYDNLIEGIVRQIGLQPESAVAEAQEFILPIPLPSTYEQRNQGQFNLAEVTETLLGDSPSPTESTFDIEMITNEQNSTNNKRLRQERSQAKPKEVTVVTIDDDEDDRLEPPEEEQRTKKILRAEYACEICQKDFRCQFSLTRHMMQNKNNHATMLQNNVEIIPGPRKFHCRETGCEEVFDSEEELHGHQSGRHDPQAEPSVCPECPFATKIPSLLVDHVLRSHYVVVNQKSIKCTVEGCSTGFATEDKLRAHLDTVHKLDRPTGSCKFCGKKFWWPSQLKAHESNHEEPKWKCDICGQRLKTKWNLSKHKKVHERAGRLKTKKTNPGQATTKYRDTEDGNIELQKMETEEFILPNVPR